MNTKLMTDLYSPSNVHPDRLIRVNGVAELLCIAKSTVWAWTKEGKLPQPLKIGERTTCWRLSEILHFIDSKNN